MRHFTHPEPWPPSITRELRLHPSPSDPAAAWNDFDASEVRGALFDLQHGRCAYCERNLALGPGKTSIDHVKPKSEYRSLTFCYSNLVLCCTDRNTCNSHKGRRYFSGHGSTGRFTPGFIDPTQPRCETSFQFSRNGSVAPSISAVEPDATETLNILNLNHPVLITFRREYIARLDIDLDAMRGQDEAVRSFLEIILSVEPPEPLFSARRQLFKA